ncbi:MAG: hypothetical protein HY741_02015 [Chloroflexi bacterium]|nr:hypothetical protein [Chloroflexota bacterium]
MMAEDIGLSQWVIELIDGIFAESDKWLIDTFQKCLRIKEVRTEVPDYGFEWAIQTLFADALIRRQTEFGISNLRINQTIRGGGNARPDIAFDKGADLVVLELKAVAGGSLGWTEGDVRKVYPNAKAVFFLTVSYPFERGWSNRLDGATFVTEGRLREGFRYSLFKKI